MGWDPFTNTWSDPNSGLQGRPGVAPKPGGGVVGWLGGLTDQSQQAKDQVANLNDQGNRSSDFADTGQQQFGTLGGQLGGQADYFRGLQSGQNSLSAEQLRQSLAQNLAGQRSMAAGASPQNAVMAARTAAIQSARLGSGLAGQQAMAGIAERNAAAKALSDMLLQQRQQELQAALQGRSTAIGAYGGVKPEGSTLDKWMPVIGAATGVGQAALMGGKKPG